MTNTQGLFRRLNQGLWWDRAWQLTMGCTAVSPACDHCWACRESHMRASNTNPKIAARHAYLTQGPDWWTGYVDFRDDNLETPLAVKAPTVWAVWNDLFHEILDDFKQGTQYLLKTFAVMRECPQHAFIVCTKRAGRARVLMPWAWNKLKLAQPLNNVIGMVTVEDQQRADRVSDLLATPGPGAR